MVETWRDIEDYEELYAISNKGRVKAKGRYYRNNGSNSYKKERILKPSDNGTGYLQVGLCRSGTCKRKYIHRLVAKAFLLNDLALEDVHHKDHNKHNNSLENLEWTTKKDNSRYYVEYATRKGKMLPKKHCLCGKQIERKSTRCRECDYAYRRK